MRQSWDWQKFDRARREKGRRKKKLTGNDDHTGLASDALRGPRKIARVETQGAILVVATTGPDDVDALGTDTGVCRLATCLEGSLLPCRAVRKQKSSNRSVLQAQNAWGRFTLPRQRQAFQADLRVFILVSGEGTYGRNCSDGTG